MELCQDAFMNKNINFFCCDCASVFLQAALPHKISSFLAMKIIFDN